MISSVRITVEKRLSNQDMLEKYGLGVEPLCPVFREGQQFIVNNLEIPPGFCSWAWSNIHQDIAIMAFGGTLSWIRGGGRMIVCCTDGFRPVIFRLERLPDAGEGNENGESAGVDRP